MQRAIGVVTSLCLLAALLASTPAYAVKGRQSVPFTYVVMSDPQYPWWPDADLDMPTGCDFDRRDASLSSTDQDDCKDSNDMKAAWDSTDNTCEWTWKSGENGPQDCAAKVENQNKVDGIKDVTNLTWPHSGLDVETPQAVIINGDLTEFFHPWQLEAYENYYVEELSDFRVLPGLGNHDYQNNTDDCSAGTLNQWKCYENAVEYAREFVTGMRVANFPAYWVDAYDPASLSYSWSHAHYLFIQMHNYPDYDVDRNDHSVDPSWTWVMAQIAEADEDGKYVVLNFHDYYALTDTQKADLAATPVVIIFVGHQLSQLGHQNTVDDSSNIDVVNKFGDHIPVWHSGHSGSPNYHHKILLAEFGEQEITVATIDVLDGNPAFDEKPAGTLPTLTRYSTHPFSLPSDHQLMPPVKGFVAIGVPKEGVIKTNEGEQEDAGTVSVTYWNDLGNISSTQWSQEASGVEDNDEHGTSLAIGDFNGDGYPDLAAGAPLDDLDGNSVNNGGRLTVVYGTDNGLTGDIEWFTQADFPGSNEAGDKTAQTLAAGDFNGDGYDDLAVGVPEEDLSGCGGTDAGSIILVYGSSNGLQGSGSTSMNQEDAGGSCEANDKFGSTLAVGDFDNDGYDDLAVGSNGEEIDGANNAGAVRVLYGSSSGITSTSGNDNLNQQSIAGTSFMADENEANDEFGFALAAGDFNADGYDDLAIGVPFEDVNCDSSGSGTDHNDDEKNDSGKVVIAYGSAGGITGVGAQDLDSRDLSGNNCENDDRIGHALAAGDFNGDGDDDLAIGAPGEDLGSSNDAGNVIYMFGGPSGLSGDSLTNLNQDAGSGGTETNDHLGWVLAAGDVDLDGYDDLAIAVPDEDWDGASNNGVVYLLFGQPSGLSWSNSTHLGGDTYDRVIHDGSENDDKFGLALAISRAIRDETPPVLSLPADITQEATSASGAVVSFTATAKDDFDGSVPVTCFPASGSTFVLGVTAVDCNAKDDAGNVANGSFKVTVVDTTPPDLTLPPDIIEEATKPTGADVSWAISATDIVDGPVTPVCTPLSGSTFALGETTVTCTAEDDAGNMGSDTFKVTVVDTTPPDVTVPPDITVTADKPAGKDVTWVASAFDIVDLDITPTCTPPSGSTFAHGTHTVTCEATDNAGNTGSADFDVTVINAQPTADEQSVSTDEDTALAITLTGDDVDDYPNPTLSFSVVTNPSDGALTGTAPNLTYTPDLNWNGSDSFTFKTNDGDLDSAIATVSITVNAVNDAPVILIDRSTATLQYSDTIGTVNITATDVDDDPLTLSSEWTRNGGTAAAGLPSNLSITGGCTSKAYGEAPETGTDCAWTLTGQMRQPSGDYDITFTVTDGGGNTAAVLDDSEPTELIVNPENASIAFDGGNTVAVQVTEDGSDASEPFSLTFTVWEAMPDTATFTALAGDISNAVPEVSVRLSPVGPGGVASSTGCVNSDNGMTGYAELLTFTCSFDAVPVNTYSVDVSIDGGYYTGADEDVLTVFDPSLGFTTGGGWFYWPGTTDRTNFGYTMKYNRKATNIQGSLMLIRHIEGAPEGEDKWRIKSNSLNGLALGSETDFGWAVFDGKATYRAPGVDTEGNHEFTFYAEDRGEPGTGVDRVWIEVRDKNDDVIADLSLDEPAPDNAVTLEGGSITVPHQGGGRN